MASRASESPGAVPRDGSHHELLHAPLPNHKQRSERAQVGIAVLSVPVAVLFTAYSAGDRQSHGLALAAVGLCVVIAALALVLVRFGGTSWPIVKRLFAQVTVGTIAVFVVANVVLEATVRPRVEDVLLSVVFGALVFSNVVLDAVDLVTRQFRLGVSFGLMVVMVVVLLQSYLQHKPCSDLDTDRAAEVFDKQISKPMLKRTIFLQLLLLHGNATVSIFQDKDRNVLSFSALKMKRPAARVANDASEHVYPGQGTVRFQAAVIVLGCCAVALYLFYNVPGSPLFEAFWVGLLAPVCAALAMTIGFALVIRPDANRAVLRLVAKQPNVVVIVFLALLNIAVDCSMPETDVSGLSSIVFAGLIGHFIVLDAVREVTRWYRIATVVIMLGLLMEVMEYYYIVRDPCESDTFARVMGQGFSKVQVKRTIASSMFVLHIQSWYLLLQDHNSEQLCFVTAKAPRRATDLSRPSHFFTANSPL